MRRLKLHCLLYLALGAALAGCGPSSHGLGEGTAGGSTVPVPLLMTDTPPTGVTPFSFEVTISSAALMPGNVSVLSAPTTVEITRLQTETASLSTIDVNPASYTSLVVTYANPSLTFENNTNATITVGGTACTSGSVCTASPTSTNQTATLTFPSALVVSSTSPQAVLLDLNLATLFSNALAADFSAGSSVSAISPVTQNGPFGAIEDFVGQVEAENVANSTITIGNSSSTLVATVNSSTTFDDFPGTACGTPSFACIADNQILSADLSVQANGTLVAENLWFKDANASDTEVEGVITAINVAAQQFTYVVLNESAFVPGLTVGNVATVHWNVAPTTTTFAADDMGVNTAGQLFAMPTDLLVGQEVSVRRNPASSGISINADRVLLRASRITAIVVGPIAFPNMTVGVLPSFFGAAGTSQIIVTVSTTGATEYGGAATVFTEIPINGVVSVRGQLFRNAGSPAMLATKVILN